MDKVCIIGSNSFSGASFAKFCLDRGMEVVGISRSIEPHSALLPYKWSSNVNKFQFHQLDINHQLEDIETLFDKLKTTHIFNFAAQSMVGQSWDFPEHWFQTNVVSSVKLHNILRNKDYLEKYVHISTPEVYGSCSGFVTEDQVFNPSTPYAVSRAAADMSLKTFFDVHQFPVVTTRAANVYGEGQPLYRIIPKTIISIFKGEKLPLHGGGHSQRSFIHMDDVSAATHTIGAKGNPGESFHISTNDIISIRDLVSTICQELNVSLEDACDISEDRPGKDAAYLLSSEKIRNELGWRDKVSLQKGIQRTIDWANAHKNALLTLPTHYIHKP